jgi:hypothetical protein
MAVIGTLWIGDRDYTLDDLSLGEIEEFETALGATLSEVDLTSAKAIIWLVYLVRRRDEPGYTLDDARLVKLTDIIRPDEDGESPLDVATVAAAVEDPTNGETDESGHETSGVPGS